MSSDDARPTEPREQADQSQEPAGDPEAEAGAETGNREDTGRSSQYRLGRPHGSRVYSLDELRAETEDMDEEAVQQSLQHFRDVTVPLILSQHQDAVRSAVQGSKALQSVKLSIADAASKTLRFRDSWSHYVAQQLSDAFATIQRLPIAIMRAWGPPNWNGLTEDELKAVVATALSGIPVSWVPRNAILRELLAADETGQLAVLETHAAEIIEDCAAAVSEARSGAFSTLATFTEEAIVAYRGGQLAASQALSASVLDTLFRTAILPPTRRYYPTLKDKIKGQPKWVPEAVAQLPAVTALKDFQPDKIPTRFNRHASAHAVCAEQYTPNNALVSLMLATSILREAHHVEHEVPDEDDTATNTTAG